MVNAPEIATSGESKVEEEKKEDQALQEVAVNGDHKDVESINGKVDDETEDEAMKAEETEVTVETATDLMTKGKRDLFCDNPTQAVTTLSEACAQFDKVFGEGHVKCAKSYFWYGNALLELARIENGVLGNALQGMPTGETPQKPKSAPGSGTDSAQNEKLEESKTTDVVVEDPDSLTEEEKDDVREQVIEAMEEAAAATEENENKETVEDAEKEGENTEEKSEEKEASAEDEKENEAAAIEDKQEEETTEQDGEDKKIETDEITEESADNKENEEGENIEETNDEEDEEEDDEEDSLKLSWQMLDWARKLIEAATEAEIEGRIDMLAQCFLKLGENLMEASHHTDAEVEFKKSIEVYQAAISSSPADDKNRSLYERSLAEAFFMAGINLVNGKNYTNAVNHFESAIATIKGLMASTERKMEALKGDSDDIKKQKDDMNEEVKQLQEILPNMEEKLLDAKANEKMSAIEEGSSDVTSEKSALQEAMRQVEMKEAAENGGFEASEAMASAPVKSINHLVKRKSPLKEKPTVNQEDDESVAKRKAETTSSDTESVPAKKPKIEENEVDAENKSSVTTA